MTSPEILAIAAANDLVPEHPPRVLAEVQDVGDGTDDPELVDLTHLPFVTIDEPSSKDLDQALAVERVGDGYIVWYAIADAAHFCRAGSAVFEEALRRGSTFYLPGLVVPMLPKRLSEDLTSINPGVDRRALVFRVHLDGDGAVVETRIVRGRVHSRLKTWYDAVQAWFDGGELDTDDEVRASLRLLADVGRARIARAEARDVVQYRRSELSIRWQGGQGTFCAMADPRNDVELWNEQISLLCNMEGARLLRDRGGPDVQAIYRAHDPPTPEALDELSAQLSELVKVHRLNPEVWRWRRGDRGLKEFLQALPAEGAHGRIAKAVHRQAMMTTRGAVFTESPERHFGVGAEAYARFTAPMREIVGVFVHKEMWELLGSRPGERQADVALRERVIAASGEARSMQRKLDREANRVVLDQMFDAALRGGQRTWSATVMGITRGKLHIQLDSPPIDVKVYKHHMVDELGVELISSSDGAVLRERRTGDAVMAVGDAVELTVLGRDEQRDRWRLVARRV